MRKFLTVLMVLCMLAASFAALPLSASASVTESDKDGSTAADAQAINLVVTEVAANTKSSIPGNSSDAFQYIEIYNRGTTAVDLYDYAIVRATYNERYADPWPSRKFDKKISLNAGSIYADYFDVDGISAYMENECNNPTDGTLAPGKVAVIWFWNSATRDASSAAVNTFGEDGPNGESFNRFRTFYQAQNPDAPVPADTLILAVLGEDGFGTSFRLNTTSNYMYGLVKDIDTGFDLDQFVYIKEPTVGGFIYTQNPDVVCMWEHGTGLGFVTATEGCSVIYTTADKAPRYLNAYYEESNTNYFEAREVDSFKQLGDIWYKEKVTPGTLLPIQLADLNPTAANAPADGNAAWTAYVDALIAANRAPEVPDRPEEDMNQGEINVDRENLGNMGQNTVGAWVYFTKTDGNGAVTYWRYQNDGQHDEDDAVQMTKQDYDIAIAAEEQAKKDAEEAEGPDWDEIIEEYNFFSEGGKYYAYPKSGTKDDAQEIGKDEYDAAMEALARAEAGSGSQSGTGSGSQSGTGSGSQSGTGSGSQSGTGATSSMQIVKSTNKDGWTYCETGDGRYYKYLVNGGSIATATEITKTEYDKVVTPAEEEDKGVSPVVWVIVAVVGAVAVVGVGVVLTLNFMKNKKDQIDETLSADEDDGFSS